MSFGDDVREVEAPMIVCEVPGCGRRPLITGEARCFKHPHGLIEAPVGT